MATVRKTKEQQLADLMEKKKQIEAQAKKIKASISQEERKKRTKHLIEIGGAVYAVLGDSYQDGDLERLTTFLKQQDARGNYFTTAMGRTLPPKK